VKNRGTLVSIDGKTEHPLDQGGRVSAVGFTNDNQLVATAGYVDGLVVFWDIQTGEEKYYLENPSGVFSMAFSPTETIMAAGIHDNVMIWDWSTQENTFELFQPGDIVAMAFSRDGKMLATGSSEGTILLWNVDGDNITPRGDAMNIIGPPRMLAFSPDGSLLAGGGPQGFAYIWDTTSNEELARIPHGSNAVTSVTFSNDGSQLFTVSRKVVRIWDVSLIHFAPKSELIPFACSHLIVNLSQDDWDNYFEGEAYRATCSVLSEK